MIALSGRKPSVPWRNCRLGTLGYNIIPKTAARGFLIRKQCLTYLNTPCTGLAHLWKIVVRQVETRNLDYHKPQSHLTRRLGIY